MKFKKYVSQNGRGLYRILLLKNGEYLKSIFVPLKLLMLCQQKTVGYKKMMNIA